MTMRENIKRLVKLNILKNRGYYLTLCCILIFWTVLQMIKVTGSVIGSGASDYFEHMGMPGFILLVALIVNGIRNYNILSNDSISMYPGTVKSRFISCLICGHIEILGILLVSIVMYLLQAVYIVVLSHLSDNVVVGSAFCLPYLLWGLCKMMGIGLLAYGAWTLWYVIMNRMQRYFYWVSLVLFSGGIFVMVKLKYSRYWLFKILRLYAGMAEDYPAYTGILLCLATWLVFIIAAYLIGIRARSWNKENRNNLIYSIVFMYFLFILVMGSVSFSGMEDTQVSAKLDNAVAATVDVSGLSGEEIVNLVEMGICQYEEIAASGNLEKWEEMDMAGMMLMSESEAREQSIPVPDGVVDGQHIYLMAWGENVMFAGKDISRPFLNYYCKNVSVQRIGNGETVCTAVKREPFVCPVNAVYGDLCGLLSDTTYKGGLFDMNYAVFGQLIIYSDEYAALAELE